MRGYVDEALRALMVVKIGNRDSDQSAEIIVWIDTAFNGFLVLPTTKIEELGLRQEALTQAVLADGRQVTLESFVCYVDWFGQVVAAQVVANNGKLPLLGTEFLANHRLAIDYLNRTVSID